MAGQKKLLVLAGAAPHVFLAETAKAMGLYTIVTDYLPPECSPAKQIADEHWEIDIKDVDALETRCRAERVDAVIAACIDPAQQPYQELCERLGLPCYGTKEQFYRLSNKKALKALCSNCGLGAIGDYTPDDCRRGRMKFPVFVKPVDSRGSRGQTVCRSDLELSMAIQSAKREDSGGEYLIEELVQDARFFQVTYFFINGRAHLIRLSDSYYGSTENGMGNVCLCSIVPSVLGERFMREANHKIIALCKSIGVQNGPAMFQGFLKDGVWTLYDAGLRFPGTCFLRVFNKVFGVDPITAMVQLSITGKPDMNFPKNVHLLNGRAAAIFFPALKPGKIYADSLALSEELRHKVISFLPRYHSGEQVPEARDVNRRYAEICILDENKVELKKTISEVQKCLNVSNERGESLLLEAFDVQNIL